jgi:acetyltransferase-like isoleucine patch superfamily enzyme
MRGGVKQIAQAAALAVAVLPALAAGFGRVRATYALFAHLFALAPGIVGDYLRAAYYRLTLAQSSFSCRISFGTFFAHADARVGATVYIGSYCVIGKARIGDRTQIASGVQILSGARQHARDESGAISGAEHGAFTAVEIGADCWIGAAAIVMADVGAGSTIAAGAVVTRPIPPGSVAVGNPARVIRSAAAVSDPQIP